MAEYSIRPDPDNQTSGRRLECSQDWVLRLPRICAATGFIANEALAQRRPRQDRL